MEKQILSQLQEVANRALKAENIEESMKHLAHAFSLFSKETVLIKKAYSDLKEQFENVNQDLKLANEKLLKKINERNLVASYLNNILKNICQGIIFIDTDGIITTFNKEAEKILQKKEEDIIFKNFWNNFKDDYFGFSIKESLKLGICQKRTTISLISLNKQLEISSSFIYENFNKGMIIMIKDITKIKKLELIANRNDRMNELGKMAAIVAHEIKNPLGGIRGYASLLYRNLENSKHLQSMAKYIIDGTKSLERLLNNVLHFSRPLDINTKPYDICLLIKEIAGLIKVDHSFSKNVILEYHIPTKSILSSIDKELIKSAIFNIIVNAFQAIENSGKITISIFKNNNICMINISDNGKGIKSDDLENIFSPFFTTKKEGNGLGLSEAYKIIQSHFGNIEVRSEINKGSTFLITLPIKER